MKAMILAAGRGERLRPTTDSLPKALVPVAGRPMIDYPLLLLRHYGIREIVINLHHLGAQIEDYLGNGSKRGLKILYSKERELLDTGGGLLKAKPYLDGGTFIVINTDVLIDLPLSEVLAFHQKNKPTASLVVRADPLADQYGSLEIDSEGRIHRFLQARRTAPAPTSVTKMMFTGVQILEPRIFDFMEQDQKLRKFSTTKETYPKMLVHGEKLFGFRFEGLWQDLGTPERVKEAEATLERDGRLHYL